MQCFCVACLTCKRITDDEASRLFLYLQKLSREWSLLNSVTWDKIGSAVADTTYGGYVIITSALLIGRICGELPTKRRIVEFILLLLGAFLLIVLGTYINRRYTLYFQHISSIVFIGGLELAALESVPSDLVDNAAILGTLSLVTAALFLLDLAGPKGKSEKQIVYVKNTKPEIQLVEAKIEPKIVKKVESETAKMPNGKSNSNGINLNIKEPNGYKQMKDKPKRFDIYGKDIGDSESDAESKTAEEHSPVWSKIREGIIARVRFSDSKHFRFI